MASDFAVGPNVNISKDGQNEAEQTIAVNPANPKNLFAMATLDATKLFAAYSTDGGATWTPNGSFADGTGTLPQACCDESAVFDQYGNLFISYLNFTDDKTIVAMSTDGGKTFAVLTSFGTNDQPKIAIGPGGSAAPEAVWIEYLDGNNLIAAQGAPVTGLGKVGAFTGQVEAADSGGGNFGKLSIGPNGVVAISWENPENNAGPASLYCAVDPNGLTNPSFDPATVISTTNVGGFAPIPPQPQRTIDAEVGLAYDYTGGPHNGRLYAVYTDSPAVNSTATDIFERHSDDNGATWSAPVKVTDDTTGASKFQPRIAVDAATGNVGVSWLDTRNGGGTKYESFLTVSLDGGQTFLPNVQVAANPSNAIAAGGNDNSGFDTGDYSGLTFYNNVLYPVWSDNTTQLANNPNSNFDLATAQVTLLSLNARPVPIVGAEGQAFSGNVATFSDNSPGVTASSFTANIDWGDGNAGAGKVTQQPDGSFVVSGSNTYVEGGTYGVTVTITGPSNVTATVHDTATIADAAITVKPPATPPSVVEGQTTPYLLATLTDADPNPTFASSYTPTITFDDGTTAVGTVQADPNVAGQFDIFSGHPLEEGAHPISVNVVDAGGATATINETLNVQDAALSSSPGVTVTGTAGQPFSTILGSFSDAYTGSFPEDFTALVNWGDGTSPTYANIIQGQAAGEFAVVGGHAYSSFGSYTYSIAVVDVGGATTTIQGAATIADATLTAGTPIAIRTVEGVALANTPLANFSSTNPAAVAGQFQATVDWGDGTTTAGTVTGSAARGFQVVGGHAYPEEGNYPVTVDIVSMPGGGGGQGSTLSINATANVADAPLTVNAVPLAVTEQAAFTSAVATFTDANPSAPLSDYSATVNWGDGSSSAGTIRPSGQGYDTVIASHTYAQDVSYNVTVNVSDVGGSQASATSSVTPNTVMVPIQGTINPASVTSLIPGAPITRVTTPAFLGHAAPNSTIQLFVVAGGMSAPSPIGTATSDAAGNWTVASRPLPDGSYVVLAASTDAAQKPNSPLASLLATPLTIDTAAPRILGATLSPATHQLSVTYYDAGAGINIYAITNPTAYTLTTTARRGSSTVNLRATSLAAAGLPGAYTATFDVGAVPQGSTYTLTVHSAAITDWAGNPLDGAFSTILPSGNGVPGSVFQGEFQVFGTAPIPVQPLLPAVDTLGAQVHENLLAAHTNPRRRRRG